MEWVDACSHLMCEGLPLRRVAACAGRLLYEPCGAGAAKYVDQIKLSSRASPIYNKFLPIRLGTRAQGIPQHAAGLLPYFYFPLRLPHPLFRGRLSEWLLGENFDPPMHSCCQLWYRTLISFRLLDSLPLFLHTTGLGQDRD
jgi:hypothetical protein